MGISNIRGPAEPALARPQKSSQAQDSNHRAAAKPVFGHLSKGSCTDHPDEPGADDEGRARDDLTSCPWKRPMKCAMRCPPSSRGWSSGSRWKRIRTCPGPSASAAAGRNPIRLPERPVGGCRLRQFLHQAGQFAGAPRASARIPAPVLPKSPWARCRRTRIFRQSVRNSIERRASSSEDFRSRYPTSISPATARLTATLSIAVRWPISVALMPWRISRHGHDAPLPDREAEFAVIKLCDPPRDRVGQHGQAIGQELARRS
jgi:hypothetical protein